MRFSQEYQPANRGRKPGSRNKTNALIDEAAPQIVKKVIEQALQGDTTAANLLLARAIPPLKAVSQPLPIWEKHGSYGELATNLLSTLGQGADPALAVPRSTAPPLWIWLGHPSLWPPLRPSLPPL